MWLLLWVHIHQETANPRAQDPVLVGVHTHRAVVKQGERLLRRLYLQPCLFCCSKLWGNEDCALWAFDNPQHTNSDSGLIGIMFIYVILHKYWLVFFLSFFPKIVFLLGIWFFFSFTTKVKPLLYITKGLMLEKGNVNMYTKLTTRPTFSK